MGAAMELGLADLDQEVEVRVGGFSGATFEEIEGVYDDCEPGGVAQFIVEKFYRARTNRLRESVVAEGYAERWPRTRLTIARFNVGSRTNFTRRTPVTNQCLCIDREETLGGLPQWVINSTKVRILKAIIPYVQRFHDDLGKLIPELENPDTRELLEILRGRYMCLDLLEVCGKLKKSPAEIQSLVGDVNETILKGQKFIVHLRNGFLVLGSRNDDVFLVDNLQTRKSMFLESTDTEQVVRESGGVVSDEEIVIAGLRAEVRRLGNALAAAESRPTDLVEVPTALLGESFMLTRVREYNKLAALNERTIGLLLEVLVDTYVEKGRPVSTEEIVEKLAESIGVERVREMLRTPAVMGRLKSLSIDLEIIDRGGCDFYDLTCR